MPQRLEEETCEYDPLDSGNGKRLRFELPGQALGEDEHEEDAQAEGVATLMGLGRRNNTDAQDLSEFRISQD